LRSASALSDSTESRAVTILTLHSCTERSSKSGRRQPILQPPYRPMQGVWETDQRNRNSCTSPWIWVSSRQKNNAGAILIDEDGAASDPLGEKFRQIFAGSLGSLGSLGDGSLGDTIHNSYRPAETAKSSPCASALVDKGLRIVSPDPGLAGTNTGTQYLIDGVATSGSGNGTRTARI